MFKKLKNTKKFHIKTKKLFLILLPLFLIVCFVAAFLIYNYTQKNNLQSVDSSKLKADSSLVSTTKKTAEGQVNKGNLNGALSSYDNAISKTSNKDLKGDLYMSKSVVYTYNNDLKSALNSANLAVDNKKDEATLANLASVYSSLKDKTNAIKYYSEAIELMKSKLKSEPELAISIQSYDAEIKRLRGN